MLSSLSGKYGFSGAEQQSLYQSQQQNCTLQRTSKKNQTFISHDQQLHKNTVGLLLCHSQYYRTMGLPDAYIYVTKVTFQENQEEGLFLLHCLHTKWNQCDNSGNPVLQ